MQAFGCPERSIRIAQSRLFFRGRARCAQIAREVHHFVVDLAGGNRERSAGRVVDCTAFQVFALAETFDETLQVSFRQSIEQRLDTLLQTLAENFRTAREVAA